MTGPFLTISVDDGHPTDLRTAELLARHGLRATFYVPARNPERDVLDEAGVRELASEFDVGGHTFNHRPLRGLPRAEAWAEIDEGRRWMEDVVGRPCEAFCYPRGKFNRETAALVRQAGYRGARTCLFNRSDVPSDAFAWGVSTHACSHPAHIQFRHALLEGNFRGIVDYVRIHAMERDWAAHFLRSVDWVARRGGVAHLYLHSWEIDENRDWEKLRFVLERVAELDEFVRVDNAELFREVAVPDA